MLENYERGKGSDSNGMCGTAIRSGGGDLWRQGLWLFLFLTSAIGLQAQEICNNGLDDDNDGYVDCFDIDCSGNFFCTSQFFGGAVPTCQAPPPPSGSFSMQVLWQSDSLVTANTRRTTMVGDIDLDGVPEVIMPEGSVANGLRVMNGANGVLERSITSFQAANNGNSVAIGDIDNDGFGEIVFVGANRQLFCYEHTGALKWSSAVFVGYAASDAAWTPLLADFEQDGLPEVYLGNQIFNGANGNLIMSLGSGSSMGRNAGSPAEPFSIAADVLPTAFCSDCAGLELIAGNTVYSVDLNAGTMTPRNSPTGFPDGLTSLADVDLDGDIDAVVVGQSPTGRGIVYCWDIQTNVQIGNTFQIDQVSTAGGAVTTAGSIATVDDVNRDGNMDIVVSGTNLLLALTYNPGSNTFTELWSFPLVSSNGRVGNMIFDFDGDNVSELVTRDDAQFYVFNAATGIVRASIPCAASGGMETPVVVDVDNDGSANILCSCGKFTYAVESASTPWTRTRTVMNQRSYYVVNVKDNLRIPQQQQGQEVGYPSSSPANYPLNAFLKQTNFLADNGTMVFPAANDAVTILNPTVDVDYNRCQDGTNDSIGVRLSVSNSGNAPIPAGTLISFYNGNPYAPGATFLRTYALPAPVPAGGSTTLPFVYVGDQGGSFTLYYQINDAGTNPLPLTGPATGHAECSLTNNFGNYTFLFCGNQPPVIDTFGLATDTILITSNEGQPYIYCVSATDPNFDPYDVTSTIGLPSLGSISGLGDGDSCFTLTPNVNAAGTTTFSIIICDNATFSLCDTAVVIWTVQPVNDPPVANGDAVSTPEETPIVVNVLVNDSDPENDPLTITILQGPSNGTATAGATSVTYTPNPNFFGLDSIYYVICDNAVPPGCDTALVVITVLPVNDPPVAQDDSISMPNDTVSVTIRVQLNDSDVEFGSQLITTILCPPSHGTATVSGQNIIYVPDSTYIGPDTLCYVICDPGTPVYCDTAYVYITITNSNQAPVANDDSGTTTYMDTVAVDLLGNDFDPDGHNFSITMIGCGPANGTVTVDTLLGIATYIPDTLFLGLDSFCYVICDVPPAGPSFCDTAYVVIDVQSDNQQPIAVTDTMTVPFNTSGTLDIIVNDSDPDNDSLTITLLGQPANGTVLISGGTVTYTPNPTFVGVDSFCYQICDNGYLPLCDTACVYFTVAPPNDIVVPNGFSPNGDDFNDFLVISAIEVFPNNTLQIFNRWGGLVFEADGYNNEWDGTYNGNPLPDGTYFYTLDPGDGSSVMTGYILIFH